MSCPKLKIPWPRVIGENPPNVDHDQENWKSVERWADGILKCIPADASHPWCIAWREACTQDVGTGATTGTWVILDNDTASTWSTDGSTITAPLSGIYAWSYEVNWNTSLSFNGTTAPGAGCKVADWQFEVSAINPYPAFAGVYNQYPIFDDGAGDFDQTQVFQMSGLLGIEGGSGTDLFFQTSLNAASWIGTASGDVEWVERLIIVQLVPEIPEAPAFS